MLRGVLRGVLRGKGNRKQETVWEEWHRHRHRHRTSQQPLADALMRYATLAASAVDEDAIPT